VCFSDAAVGPAEPTLSKAGHTCCRAGCRGASNMCAMWLRCHLVQRRGHELPPGPGAAAAARQDRL
jgi:hypothetical protein